MIQPEVIEGSADTGRSLHEPLSPAERLLWDLLRDRRLGGYRFRRRAPIGPFVVDFFCHQLGLIVQLRSGQQQYRAFADQLQSDWLDSHGYHELLLSPEEIEANSAAVGLKILHVCQHMKS